MKKVLFLLVVLIVSWQEFYSQNKLITICAPSEKDLPKLKFFVELDDKYIGFIPDRGIKTFNVESGNHKLSIYSNLYVEGFFATWTYTNTPTIAKQKRYEGIAEIMIQTSTNNEILYIIASNGCSRAAGLGVYGIKNVSQEQVNEWLAMGLLEQPANTQYTPTNYASNILTPTLSYSPSVPQQTIQQPVHQSDVDKNIYQSATKANNTYVLIIANENYEFLDKVNYATNDGQIFKEYCVKTLGVPEKQIFYYENATVGKISDGVGKLKYCLDNFEGAKAIVYYCGHGIPDEKTGQAYLIPTDGKATNTSICYSLDKLYKTLAATKAQSITYFMDACFTGANKEGSMLVAARGVARAPEKETLSGKTIVFSASSGDETAMTLEEEGHGLFTYYLLKKLQETNGDVTYGELADYINRNVKKDAFLINEKPQTPVVATSPAVVNSWKQMKLK